MKRLLVLALVPLLLAAGPKKKQPPADTPPPPRLSVVEIKVVRTTENTLELDGKVVNSGVSPLHKVVLRFKAIAPGGEVVTTQLGALEELVLDKGEEAEFHFRMREHARAVAVKVEATAREAEITVGNPGPHMIE